MPLLTDHVWRPMSWVRKDVAGPCQFMNCRRPRGEHERAVKRVTA